MKLFVVVVLTVALAKAGVAADGGIANHGKIRVPIVLPSCPRLHAGPNCTFALPSCEIISGKFSTCMGTSSCDCLRECDAVHYVGSEERDTEACYEGGMLASLDEAANRSWFRFDKHDWVEDGVRGAQRFPDAGQAVQPPQQMRWSFDEGGNIEGSDKTKGVCPNKCNSRGACDGGTCVCNAPYSGMDCAIPFDRPEGPNAFVYVYELPPGFNAWRPRVAMDRNIAVLLYEFLLTSSWRTLDPHEAAFFWVPVSAMGLIPYGVVLQALNYVRTHYPFYNASGGRDHVVAFPWDSGACWISNHWLVRNITSISHFGLREKGSIMSCNCSVCGHGGTIIVPDVMEHEYKRRTHMRYNVADTRPRRTHIFFGGRRTGSLRNRMLDALESMNHTDKDTTVHISEQRVDLADAMANSKFCLVPPSAGFTTRGTLAIVMGCVPVVIGDLRQPLAQLLDWRKFSIQIPEDRLHMIVHIIRASNYTRLKAGVDAVWHHFSWASIQERLSDEPLESDAMHMLMRQLKSRALDRFL